jgi:beta-glucosidase
VVFAADYSCETFDRPSLSLPGDQNALISAVAAANPHTVVVLNTGGPVLMPWLGSVASVIEAWYPGEQDGAAIPAVLCGDVNPSGHLR